MKYYKKILLLIFSLPLCLLGQNITQGGISASAGIIGNNFSLNYTIGAFSVPQSFLTQSFTIKNKQNNEEKETINTNLQFSVFPNPVRTLLNIAVTCDEKISSVEIKIIDLQGHLIKTENNFTSYGNFVKTSVNTSILSSGTYIVRIIINKKYSSETKILKK